MSVPKCGPLKSKWLLELANDVTFLGAQAFMTGSGGVQGSDCRGGGLWWGRACIERWNKKSPGPAHPCATPATR